MTPFLTRFYSEVADNLGDPSTAKRYTNAKMYSDLTRVQERIYQCLLNGAGQMSELGYAECIIPIVAEQDYYDLPPNFRQFITFERRVAVNQTDELDGTYTITTTSLTKTGKFSPTMSGRTITFNSDDPTIDGVTRVIATATADAITWSGAVTGLAAGDGYSIALAGDPRLIIAWVGSVPTYADGPGVRLLGPGRGFQFIPRPTEAWAGDWTLCYRKGPVKLHDATLSSMASDGTSFVCGSPATNHGEVVLEPNYYAGCLIEIYSATTGAPQRRMCTASSVSGSTVTLRFDNKPFNPVPTGTMLYQVLPDLDESVDGLYALDVAILACSRRTGATRRSMLIREREDLWKAARGLYSASASDRPPERLRPPRHDADDPYE